MKTLVLFSLIFFSSCMSTRQSGDAESEAKADRTHSKTGSTDRITQKKIDSLYDLKHKIVQLDSSSQSNSNSTVDFVLNSTQIKLGNEFDINTGSLNSESNFFWNDRFTIVLINPNGFPFVKIKYKIIRAPEMDGKYPYESKTQDVNINSTIITNSFSLYSIREFFYVEIFGTTIDEKFIKIGKTDVFFLGNYNGNMLAITDSQINEKNYYKIVLVGNSEELYTGTDFSSFTYHSNINFLLYPKEINFNNEKVFVKLIEYIDANYESITSIQEKVLKPDLPFYFFNFFSARKGIYYIGIYNQKQELIAQSDLFSAGTY